MQKFCFRLQYKSWQNKTQSVTIQISENEKTKAGKSFSIEKGSDKNHNYSWSHHKVKIAGQPSNEKSKKSQARESISTPRAYHQDGLTCSGAWEEGKQVRKKKENLS